mgnify:CR=1 FL=1
MICTFLIPFVSASRAYSILGIIPPVMTKLVRIVPVVLASALMVPAFTPTVANANPVDQQRQRVEDIVDELERLEEDARRIGEEYVLAVDAQTLLDEEIVEAEARVAAKEAAIRLNWVNLPEKSRELLPQLDALSAWSREFGHEVFILCGMGGSSLAPEVMAQVYKKKLTILDSTDRYHH